MASKGLPCVCWDPSFRGGIAISEAAIFIVAVLLLLFTFTGMQILQMLRLISWCCLFFRKLL